MKIKGIQSVVEQIFVVRVIWSGQGGLGRGGCSAGGGGVGSPS